MRQIRFRGKDFAGIWWYGYLSKHDDNPVIHPVTCVGSSILVDGETVGQFTGLHDNNGKEIYEGDIIRVPETEFNTEINGDVRYQEDSFVVISRRSGTATNLSWVVRKTPELKYFVYPAEVIGNIHDNQDLLTK